MPRTLRVLPILFSRRRLASTFVVLLGMAFLARLGIWQLDRLEQRRARNAELQLALDAPPLDLGSIDPNGDFEALKDRDVIVRGEFDSSQQILLKLQKWAGRTGAHLVAPLMIDDGQTAVLVDRGWIPESDASVENWSKFHEPGLVTIRGYLALSQSLEQPDEVRNQPAEPQRDWYRVDIEAIQAQLPYSLLPFYVAQAPPPEGNIEPPFRGEREVDLSEGPHLGYAIQWFIFSLMLGGAYVIYVSKGIKTG